MVVVKTPQKEKGSVRRVKKDGGNDYYNWSETIKQKMKREKSIEKARHEVI
jgi:hypothetical protein